MHTTCCSAASQLAAGKPWGWACATNNINNANTNTDTQPHAPPHTSPTYPTMDTLERLSSLSAPLDQAALSAIAGTPDVEWSPTTTGASEEEDRPEGAPVGSKEAADFYYDMARDGHADMATDGSVAGGDGVFEPEMLELLPTMAADGDELADTAASNMANVIQVQTYEK